MNQLKIVKSELFNSIQCDFWQNENGDVFMTTEQLGTALEYSQPKPAISKLIERNDYLKNSEFSGVNKLTTPRGGTQETRIFTEDGIYEVTMLAKTPKAKEFRAWVRRIIKGIRKGEILLYRTQSENEKLLIQKQRAEAMLLNARTRQAKLILEMQKNNSLSPVAIELLHINALEVITERDTHYRPEVEKTYTATEIAEELGLSANKIGKIANANGLKTAEFGIEVLDKSRYSNKQVPSFRYNERGKQKLRELASETTA